MRKLIPYLTLLTIYGCSTPESSPTTISSSCPEKPPASIALTGNDVQEISLNDQTLTKSGQASATKSIGYKFPAQSGQKLSYTTDSSICIWVYSPNNELISGGSLPKTGYYTIQISAPKGLTTFDLKMSLGILQAFGNSPSLHRDVKHKDSEYDENIQPSVATPSLPAAVSSTQTNSIATTSKNTLSQDQALEIVKKWYQAKPQMFAPPFDTSLVEQLTTGKLYQKMIAPDSEVSPIAWLRTHNSYYTYNKSEIRNVVDFSNSGEHPYIKVKVFEELYLHAPNRIDTVNSGSYQGNFMYFFTNENGVWKIYDYQKVN